MAPPLYRLFTPPGSLFAFAPLVVSEYVGVSVRIESNTDDIEEAIASKSPTGKVPILETKKGDIIVSSQTIARFLANLRVDSELLGTGSLRDTVAIEDWTNWATQELELPVCISYYMAMGFVPFDETDFAKAKNDIALALEVLEGHLEPGEGGEIENQVSAKTTTYLVLPEGVTLADIVIACYLVYPFTLVYAEGDLENFPNVTRWFRNCMQQPEFISILGRIECGKREG